MKKTLVIIMRLMGQETMTLDIPNPREDLTNLEVSKALSDIALRDVLQNDKGVLVHSFQHAYVRKVTEELLP